MHLRNKIYIYTLILRFGTLFRANELSLISHISLQSSIRCIREGIARSRDRTRNMYTRITVVTRDAHTHTHVGIRWHEEWYFSRASTGNPISRLPPRRDLFAEKLEM